MATTSLGTPVYSSRGINVNPTSSFLHLRIEDVDCSAVADFPKAPIDGQFVVAPGKIAYNLSLGTADYDAFNAKMQNDTLATLDEVIGTSLAMVWLSQFKTDQDALGSARVPVVRGPLRFKTKLFIKPIAGMSAFAVGTQLTVQGDDTEVSGSASRLLLFPVNKKCAWVVGFVTSVVSTVAGSEEIEVQLYDFPRQVSLAS